MSDFVGGGGKVGCGVVNRIYQISLVSVYPVV